ncbi:MAG: hypothetical protein H7Z41_20035 [Cytophagales bacterium]|nr:hypothetical protein [Armatimonadota bacterium]
MTIAPRGGALLAAAPILLITTLLGSGCSRPQPTVMAPPMNNPSAPMVNTAPPVAGGQAGALPSGEGVFDWHDVPTGQEVPITRGVFDQSGYQLFAGNGETIVVPFANQNMYVMRFGKSTNGRMYFVSSGTVPTLYVPNGGYLENAVAQGARWFPFPQNYAYTQPVYLGIAPSWGAYTGMGWYPGMAYYGGYWSPNPYGYGGGFGGFAPMVGLSFLIGGRPYYGWNSYSNYYRSNPGSSVRMRTVYNYNSVRRTSPSAFGRSRSGTASSRTGGTGSFGSSSRRTGGTGPSGSFGSGSGSSGFGTSGRRSGGSFGSGSSSGYGGSFGSGSGRRTFGGGSFGSSSSGSSSSSGGSFGSSRRSSGGGSFGGGSFGGGRRSSGGFGRRR